MPLAQADAALASLRELAQGIHPAVLTDRGIVAALESATRQLPVSWTLFAGSGVGCRAWLIGRRRSVAGVRHDAWRRGHRSRGPFAGSPATAVITATVVNFGVRRRPGANLAPSSPSSGGCSGTVANAQPRFGTVKSRVRGHSRNTVASIARNVAGHRTIAMPSGLDLTSSKAPTRLVARPLSNDRRVVRRCGRLRPPAQAY